MQRVAVDSSLAYLFGKLNDEDESDVQPTSDVNREIGRRAFKHERGTGHAQMEKNMRKKCRCTVTKDDTILEKLQLFRLGDTKNKSSLENSASRVLKQLEIDMSTKSKATGRPNVMTKWLDTRCEKPLPEDYEFRHCLKSTLTFDPVEKVFGIDDMSSERGEPALDQIYLSSPRAKYSRPRRNPFGAVQLCPHSLNTTMGITEGSRSKREEHVIDFLTNVATMNQEFVQPRAGTRRAESLYYESMFNNIMRNKDG